MLRKIFSKLSTSLVIVLFCCFLLANGDPVEKQYTEEEGVQYLKRLNAEIQAKTTESALASWAYDSNITDENLRLQLEASAKLANYTQETWRETIKYPWKSFKDPDVRRQFQKFSVLGPAILSPEKYKRYNKIISDMQSIYSKAKVCNYSNRSDCTLQLEPELTEIFIKSRNPEELRYYWEQWRNVAGKPVRNMFKEYVRISNEAAVLNNFTDNAQFWLKDYESQDFKSQVEELWQQLRPLYLQLHAYVRRQLREKYGEQHVSKRGPIPAHLLGNMWAQSWRNIFEFTAPYPNKPSVDVTPNMVEQGYTPLRMFKLAEEFFTSLGLSPMPETFWKRSILEKPDDGRDLICHASAWDFYDGEDFRIKQCTRVTMEDLNTVHHEMGHVQYFLQYKNEPLVYKEGANPGFHEAVGDVMALSVSTPDHLRKIGLLNATGDDPESDINQLYNMALSKIAFLPFGYLMDQWRWNVFEGKIPETNYNCKWWQLREKYQGLSPSVERSEEDFDPGAKYHTVANVPYIRYFVSYVIQFQFHRSLCIAAKQYDPKDPNTKPLHKCDIYQSKEAGALLKKMLQMGSSKPWPDAMEVITGQRKIDARPLVEYFESLQKWLEKENQRTNEFIGWESRQKECIPERNQEDKAADAFKKQGNYEDENIGYSYAEFVRPDDNSFGFPDYVEETQPPYLSLRQRSKENLQTNYYLPDENAGRLAAVNKLYPPNGMQDKNEFIDLFRLKRLSELNGKTKKRHLLSHAAGHQVGNTPAENQNRGLNTEKTQFVNGLLQNIMYSGNRAARLTKRKSVLRREVNSDEKHVEVCGRCRKIEKLPKKDGSICDLCFKKAKDKSPTPGERDDDCRDESKQDSSDESMKICNGEVLESDEEIMQLVTEICTQKLSSHDLSCKIQAIKERVEKLLKNRKTADPCKSIPKRKGFYTVSAKPYRKLMIICLRRQDRPSKWQLKSDDCVRRPLTLLSWTDYLKSVNSNQNNAESGKNSLDGNSQDIKNICSEEGNNEGTLNVHLTGEGKNKIKIRKKPDGMFSTYVIFLGKSPIGRRKKKSYTEYHFRRKYPVLYNDVVITAGKTERPEDMCKKDSRIITDFSGSLEQFGHSMPKQEDSDLLLQRRHFQSTRPVVNPSTPETPNAFTAVAANPAAKSICFLTTMPAFLRRSFCAVSLSLIASTHPGTGKTDQRLTSDQTSSLLPQLLTVWYAVKPTLSGCCTAIVPGKCPSNVVSTKP